MMKNLIVFFVGVAAVASVVSADSDDFFTDADNDLQTKYSNAVKSFTYNTVRSLTAEDPSKSYVVSPIEVLCTLSQLLANFACENDENVATAMKFLNAENRDEITQMLNMLQEKIDNGLSLGVVDRILYGDKNDIFTEEFTNSIASICGGVTSNLDYEDGSQSAAQVNEWLSKDTTPVAVADESMFSEDGMVIAYYWKYDYNLNHYNNPTGMKTINFKKSDGEVIDVQAIYGKGYIKYLESEEYDAKFLRVSLSNSDDQYEIIAMPNNSEDLPNLVERLLSDTSVLDNIVASMEWICVNLTYMIAGVDGVVNNPSKYLRDQGINLQHYNGIFENDNCNTNVNEIFQKIDITPSEIAQRDSIDSPMCQGVDVTVDVTIDRPGLYMIMSESLGAPLVGGLYQTNIITEDDA